jgi:hypothetical protein
MIDEIERHLPADRELDDVPLMQPCYRETA